MISEYIKTLKKAYEDYKIKLEESKHRISDLDKTILDYLSTLIATKLPLNITEYLSQYVDLLDEKELHICEYIGKLSVFNREHPDLKVHLDGNQIDMFVKIQEKVTNFIKQSEVVNVDDLSYLEDLIEGLENISGDDDKKVLFTSFDELKKSFTDLQVPVGTQNGVSLFLLGANISVGMKLMQNQSTTSALVEKQEVSVPIVAPLKDINPQDYNVPLVQIFMKNYKRESIPQTNVSADNLTKIFTDSGHKPRILSNMSDKNKEILLKYVDVDNAIAVRRKLKEYGVDLLSWVEKRDSAVVNILLFSSPEIIDKVYEIISASGFDFVETIDGNYSMLLSEKLSLMGREGVENKAQEKPVSRLYESFVENIEFFKKQGFDIEKIIKKARTAAIHNSELVINNYNFLSTLYHIDFSSGSLSCLRSHDCLRHIDSLLEVHPYGYDAACQSKTLISNITKEEIVALKKDTNNSLIKRYDENGVSKFMYKKKSSAGEFVNYANQLSDNDSVYESHLQKEYRIDQYVNINLEVFNNPYIKNLEENYKTNDMLYEIKNPENNIITRISRYKVLRVLTFMLDKKVCDSITYSEVAYALGFNSLFTKEEADNIKMFKKLVDGFQREV